MSIKLATGLFAALAITAAPAAANETAAAAQMTGAIDAAAATGNSATDSEFGELFADWQAIDSGKKRANAAGQLVAGYRGKAVSIPSLMPLEGSRMTSSYGMRNHPILQQRRNHNGVDLAAPNGTPVYATADGLVGMAQWYSSYGNYVQIEHGGEMQTRYAHLSSYVVADGERVRKGQLIGYVGSTGRSTGPHLHYEVRVGGEPVDPRPYMQTQLAFDDSASAGRGGPE